MNKNDTFSERVRPSNSGEVGCYTAIAILALIATFFFMEGKGTPGVIITFGVLFIYSFVIFWIKNRLSFREVVLESFVMLVLIATFSGFTQLFDNWAKANEIANWLLLSVRFLIIGLFLLVSFISVRFTRRRDLYPHTPVQEMTSV